MLTGILIVGSVIALAFAICFLLALWDRRPW